MRTSRNILMVVVAALLVSTQAVSADTYYSDGTYLNETFEGIELGEIPSYMGDQNQPGVSDTVAKNGTKSLRLSNSSGSWGRYYNTSTDTTLVGVGTEYAIQFDFILNLSLDGTTTYYSTGGDTGGLFQMGFGSLLVGLSQDVTNQKVILTAAGETLCDDLSTMTWHNLLIDRDNTNWDFYLDNELVASVSDGPAGEIARYGFGDSSGYSSVQYGVYYDDLKIGTMVVPEPATMVLLGVGGLLTLLRRRR